MNFNYEDYLIFSCYAGSKLYGTETPESDVDIRGVLVAPKDYYLGLYRFEEHRPKDQDLVYRDLKKFLKLCIKGNPNIIEQLWCPVHFRITNTIYWEKVLSIRNEFINKQTVTAHIGMAKSHFHRMDRSGRDCGIKGKRLIEQFGFNCYSEDTEFLTDTGWKKYDDISKEDKLATFDTKNHKVQYQNYIDRFDSKYNGTMYNIIGYHTDINVTANHRMYVRKYSCNQKILGDWEFVPAAKLYHTFDSINVISPKTNIQNMPTEYNKIPKELSILNYLRIMGWYISDGTSLFRDKKLKCIRISQSKPKSRLTQSLRYLRNQERITCNEYTYKAKNKIDLIKHWDFPRDVSASIYENCGHKNKKIPNWCFFLTKRMMSTLLHALIQGNGTKLKQNNTYVYYTKYKSLANDVNRLAFLCGFESSISGPYKNNNNYKKSSEMYFVHINKCPKQYKRHTRKCIKKRSANNKRVVCFMVKNETLITRRNGKIALHGNCKDASHVIRVLQQCLFLIRDGVIFLPHENASYLLDIKQGRIKLDEVKKYYRLLLDEIRKYEKDVRASANIKVVNDVCVDILETLT